jgi:hypothetical protein
VIGEQKGMRTGCWSSPDCPGRRAAVDMRLTDAGGLLGGGLEYSGWRLTERRP